MDFDALFSDQLDLLKKEGNYRIFAELEFVNELFQRRKAMTKTLLKMCNRLVFQ